LLQRAEHVQRRRFGDPSRRQPVCPWTIGQHQQEPDRGKADRRKPRSVEAQSEFARRNLTGDERGNRKKTYGEQTDDQNAR